MCVGSVLCCGLFGINEKGPFKIAQFGFGLLALCLYLTFSGLADKLLPIKIFYLTAKRLQGDLETAAVFLCAKLSSV